MSHERRIELESALKHAKNYIWRLFIQTVSNFWQTVKGQQIIQLCVCALISLGFSIYLGITESDKVNINIRAVMFFCVTLFILCVLMSIITAIFHLDREREMIKSINAETDNSNGLSILPEENEAEKAIDAIKQEQVLEIKNLEAKHQEEIKKLNSNYVTIFNNLKEEHKQVIKAWGDDEKKLKAELEKNSWLSNKAEEQAENIDKFVFWRNAQFLQNIIEDRIYFLWFQIEVFNASVFEIIVDEKIGGKILFEGQRLRLEKSIYQPPIIIKPNSMAGFTIKQELDTDEVNLINEKVILYNKQREHFHKEMPEDYQFYSKDWLAGKIIFPPEVELKGLEINMKGSNNFPQVRSKTLTQMSDVRTSIEVFTKYQ